MRKIIHTLLFLAIAFAFAFCTNKSQKPKSIELTHEKSAKPDYSIVFPNDKVNRIDIKIDSLQWNNMLVDLKSNIGGSDRIPPERPVNNSDQKPAGPRPNRVEGISHQKNHEGPPLGGMEMQHGMKNDSIQTPGIEFRMGPPPVGKTGGSAYEPIWSYCDILFNNEKWNKVGIHFKGNSSLRSAYQSGIKKLSFKLDFDQFEDEFPEIKNQRFYGFKQLNLKNNYDDLSFIKEILASELFADFGLVTPKTSFCQLFLDFGNGPQYFGLYTLVEEVDDTVIETAFSSGKGNLYKPEGMAATFAKDSFRSTDMNRKTNKKSNDYSDVQQLNTVVNSLLRIENNTLWKSQLNEVFDVSVFLKWLAANNVMQNWDTYGKMPHNYYLYNNPSTKKLEWIPWDNNEAFQHGKMGGALSLSLNEVGENWPLIRYIIDDEEWKAEYNKYVADFTKNVYSSPKINVKLNIYRQLISGKVVGEKGENSPYSFLNSDSEFYEAIEEFKKHVLIRNDDVTTYLKTQKFI